MQNTKSTSKPTGWDLLKNSGRAPSLFQNDELCRWQAARQTIVKIPVCRDAVMAHEEFTNIQRAMSDAYHSGRPYESMLESTASAYKRFYWHRKGCEVCKSRDAALDKIAARWQPRPDLDAELARWCDELGLKIGE